MKKYILLFLFINFFSVANTQVIKGTVYDEKTNSTIGFSSVYYNGTFVGTTSDLNGYFEFISSINTSMPLTFSAIGYYSFNLTKFSLDKPLKIYLKPKEYELKETVIKSRSLETKRKKNLILFKYEFLGTTDNAQKCKILNEQDITFNYGSDKDTLKAFASKPILIDNTALGYKITYYLDKFEYYKRKDATFFSGNIIFTENETSVEKQKQFYESRKYAYLGSRMHFFRALWADSLKTTKFSVANSKYTNLNYKDLVSQDSKNNYYLQYPGELRVVYTTRVSDIDFLKKYVFFNKNGYFDPTGINWLGKMGDQRIAEWLPYEYSIDSLTATSR